jgi:hypothetical protein
MIEWLDTEKGNVGEGARKVLANFKKTGFAAELEEDGRTWTFVAWARRPDPPARLVLRNDAGETAVFTLEPTGLWRKGT